MCGREISREALVLGASASVAAHHHVLGDPEPSMADRVTNRPRPPARRLGIGPLDHLVIGSETEWSPGAGGRGVRQAVMRASVYLERVDRMPATSRARTSIDRAVRQGVPEESVALYARWWQFETWLRDVMYVELVALLGPSWRGEIKAKYLDYMKHDDLVHMRTADNTALITYTDFGFLLKLVNDYWDQISYALLDRDVWTGRVKELRPLRNRVAHCRRPHGDDLTRLELLLSDLEHGAFESYASTTRSQHIQEAAIPKPLKIWFAPLGQVQDHLRGHADRQYHSNLNLRISRRPWASRTSEVFETPGYLLHLHVIVGMGTLRSSDVWEQLLEFHDALAFLLLDPYSAEVVLPASLPPDQLAEACSTTLTAALQSIDRRADPEFDPDHWFNRQPPLDWRVKLRTGWNIVDDTTVPITIFDTGR